MPYIKKDRRTVLDPYIDELLYNLWGHSDEVDDISPELGEINYIVSKILWHCWEYRKNYGRAAMLIGTVNCAIEEFRRRVLNPYEDDKIQIEGDIFE